MIDYRLYLITDNPSRYYNDWLANIEAAVQGGVTVVQFRDTETQSAKQRFVRARALQDMLKRYKTPLVINNDVALAAELGADGVHVGQSDMPPAAVRRIVGERLEIGLSINSISQIPFVDTAIVNCIGIGPVYDARKTKHDAATAIGCAGLAEIAVAIDLNNVAIGGITLDNAQDVMASGAGGLAVVSTFSQSDDPCATAKLFRKFV